MAVENNGVPGIVAAGVTRDVIERGGHIVNDLTLPFIAPLRANYDNCLRRRLVHLQDRPPGHLVAFSNRTIPRQIHT